MSIFKRLSATFVSRVDQLVSQVENHDAVVDAAIKESRQAAAKAKVRLARVRNDGEQLKTKIKDLNIAVEQWSTRARALAEQNESAALECVRRRNACQQQISQLERSLQQHRALEERLSHDINNAEKKLSEMSQQRNLMRTRQSTAEALNTIANVDDSVSVDVSDAFERWETRILEAEMELGTHDTVDTFERELLDTENTESLRAELHALLAEEDQHNAH